MWFGRNLEIKLKVTDVIPEGTPGFGPTDLRVESYIWNNYLATPLANNLTFWTFTKCWGNAVLQPRYTYMTQQPGPMQDHLFPWFESCFPWYACLVLSTALPSCECLSHEHFSHVSQPGCVLSTASRSTATGPTTCGVRTT